MFPKWTLRKYLIKTIKIAGWIVFSFVALFILIALAIQIPAVQNRLTSEAVGFLKKKIGTEVSLKHISLSFPKSIVLTGLYLEDQSRDTLLYAGNLSINTDLWALLDHRIELNDVELDDFDAFVSRPANDSVYNFGYIINAFGSDTTNAAQVDTTQAPWEFAIETVLLTKTHLSYKDAFGGDDADVRFEKLEIDVDEFDLNQPLIVVSSIELEGVDADIIQRGGSTQAHAPPAAATASSDPSAFKFDIDEISLQHIIAHYENKTSGQTIRLNLGELILEADQVDLQKQQIVLTEFKLTNSFISYQQAADTEAKRTGQSSSRDSITPSKPWMVSLKDLDLQDNNIRYDDFNTPAQKEAIDFSHLWLSKLNIQAEDLAMEGDMFKGDLKELSFNEKSGFEVTSFQTSFALTKSSAFLKDLVLTTPQSKIALQAKSSFASVSSLGSHYADAKVDLRVARSTLSVKDALFFVPGLLDSIPLKIPRGTTVDVDADVNGSVKDLIIDHISIETWTKTTLHVEGTIKGLPGSDPLMHLTLREFHTVKEDIAAIVPDTLLPKNSILPAWVTLKGKFDGTPTTPKTILTLTSDAGAIDVTANMNLKNDSQNSSYDADINVNNFQLGRLLGQQKTMGNLTMNAKLEGTGLTIDELDTKLDVIISQFQYLDYTYKDFKVNGRLERYFFSGTASLNDKNLSFNLDGDLNYNAEIPEYKFMFDLKVADFNALHLTDRPLKARGKIDVKLATTDFKIINGNLDIRKVAIYNGDVLYAVDSLLFASIDQKGKSNITIRSDLLSGDFEGTINLFSMPDALKRHFNKYFSLRDTLYNKPTAPQNFKFNLVLKNTDLLTEVILPDLEPFVPGEIVGDFNSEQNKLNLKFDVARIQYGAVGLDSIKFNVTSDANSLDYNLALRKVKMDTLRIEALALTGSVAHDSIRTKFIVLDSIQKDKYVLGGAFYSLEKTFRFHFLPDQVIMNYAPWQTPADNSLQFTSKGITAHHFSITNINEKIELLTQQNADSATAIVFKDLNLQNITSLVEGTILADGLINGDFNVSGKGSFQSNLKIQHLNVFKQAWGDLALRFGRKEDGPYDVDLRVDGENASIQASGNIKSDSASTQLDLSATIAKLNLAVVEPFAAGQLKDTKGNLSGDLKVTGNSNSPAILGSLVFNDASFTPSFVNSKFMLKKETISFTREGIVLSDFKVLDEKNNTASLKGIIRTEHYTDFDMDLTLVAKNFQVINTKPEDNDLFYGNVAINTTAKISGNVIQPKVEMEISLDDKSDFTYVVPQSEKGVLEQKGIVRFVDKDAKKDPFMASLSLQDTAKSTFRGLDLTANIELDEKEKFSIVIDPITGDKLSVQGNSTLTLAIDPSGNMQLSGRYEITEGTYDLTFYKLVKRNFAIEKGSTITWTGDPLDATMDIRASFTVETSPMELFPNPSTDSDQLRQRLPFLVYLNIKGNLLTPDISFELDMPVDKRNTLAGGVYAKIKDINTRESDLNKQVFALLILRRFISDNVFDSQGGSDLESTARRSVSKLLTEQLNRLSENVKGIQVSFDVKSYEDYSSGQAQGQTELQLGVSKSLLNDRLVVKVAGNVDIEGNTSNQNSVSDYIGDLALEYKLTPDGRFRITGFRKSNYDVISNQLIETGAGLIYIKDYDTLRELLKANTKEK